MGRSIAAEAKLPPTERQTVSGRLDERYRELGTLVAGMLSGPERVAVTAENPEIERLLEEIRRERESLKRVEEKDVEERESEDKRPEEEEPEQKDPEERSSGGG